MRRDRCFFFSLLLLSSCAPSNGTLSFPTDVIKLSYYRFNLNRRTQQYVPEYRAMISEGWILKRGRDLGESFAKNMWSLHQDPDLCGGFYLGDGGGDGLPNELMGKILATLESKGLGQLPTRDPAPVTLEWLKRIEKNPAEAQVTRFFVAETDRTKRIYFWMDAYPDEKTRATYVAVERMLYAYVGANTVRISIEVLDSLNPR